MASFNRVLPESIALGEGFGKRPRDHPARPKMVASALSKAWLSKTIRPFSSRRNLSSDALSLLADAKAAGDARIAQLFSSARDAGDALTSRPLERPFDNLDKSARGLDNSSRGSDCGMDLSQHSNAPASPAKRRGPRNAGRNKAFRGFEAFDRDGR
ncbi:hypothetical protein M885DRAFT_522323 [Pelagophyceae sp. CCMP2097]|nr:hypothetical protein M885DRAFT_522323 [Pelagophyceae sp. CCMP2097]